MRRVGRVALAVILGLALVAPAPVSGDEEFFDWPAESVDEQVLSWGSSSPPSMARANDGSIHVVDVEYGPRVVYRKRTAAGWQSIKSWSGTDPVIKLDGAGHAHIAFEAYVGTKVVVSYATNRFGGWQTIRLTEGSHPQLAVDALGEAHLLYFNKTPRLVAYATNRKGYWKVGPLPTETGGSLVSLADQLGAWAERSDSVAPTPGSPGMAGGRQGPKLAGVIGIADPQTTVGPTADPIADAQLAVALDSSNRLHAVFIQDGVRYVTNRTGRWVNTRLSTRTTDAYPQVYASGSTAHVLYSQAGGSQPLRHMTNATGSWVTRTVAANGRASNLVRTGDGRLHTLVGKDDADPARRGIYEARFDGGPWSLTQRTRYVGDASLAATSSGTIHMAYGLAGTWYASSVPRWSQRRLAGADTTTPAVTADTTGTTHVAFAAAGTAPGIFHTSGSGSSWAPAVRVSTGRDSEPAIGTDSRGITHIVFARANANGTPDGVYYATDASGSWSVTRVTHESDTEVGRCPSIAIDSSDKVHVTYVSSNSAATFYVTNASGAWVASTIPTDLCVSLAIDTFGTLHTAFDMGFGLRYGTKAVSGGEWTFADTGLTMENARLAVDASAKAHLVSLHGEGLVYATNRSSAWLATALEETLGYRDEARIAATGAGTVAITHRDWGGIRVRMKTGNRWRTFLLSTDSRDVDPDVALSGDGAVRVVYARGTTGISYAER